MIVRVLSGVGAAMLTVLLLAVAGPTAGSALAPADSGCPIPLEDVGNGVAVCVDRGEGGVYREGDPITICASVNLAMILIFPPPPPPTIRVVNSTNGSLEHILFEFKTFSGQECVTTDIVSPTGAEVIRVDAIDRDGTSYHSDTTSFVSVPR